MIDFWEQAKFSVEYGGIGLRSAVDHAPAAFTASVMGAQVLVTALLGSEDFPPPPFSQHIMDTLTTVLSPVEVTVTQESLAGYDQRTISSHIDKRNSHIVDTNIIASGDKREMARRRSLTLPYAGAWLHTVPNPALRTRLEPMEFALGVKLRLGINIFEEGTDCALCLLPMDVCGDRGGPGGRSQGQEGQAPAEV